jgi:hypothetical protein
MCRSEYGIIAVTTSRALGHERSVASGTALKMQNSN